MKSAYLILSLFIFLFSCRQNDTISNNDVVPAKAKKVILLIGDGMGLSQISSVYYFGNIKKPAFSRFPVVGLQNTSSAKEKITDSAAGATAFASGIKTYNKAIGKDTLEQDSETIVEHIRKNKIPAGLIATSSITHATPAAFYAHANQRYEEELIASQMALSGVDFFAGGGLKFFNKRKDKADLISVLKKENFIIDTTELQLTNPDTSKRYGYLLADKGLPSKLEGRNDFLNKAGEAALSYLSKKSDKFFLMIEGSQIDWEGHATNKDGVIAETKDFNDVINLALDYAEKDGETLVIVTADHETGGFSLSPKWDKDHWDYNQIEGSFYEGARKEGVESAHTASLIPVFAFGPGAEKFSGLYQNTDIHAKILKVTGW